jgi:hypothetical protein
VVCPVGPTGVAGAVAGVALGMETACDDAEMGEGLVATFWPEFSETTDPLLQATESNVANRVAVIIEDFASEYIVCGFIIILADVPPSSEPGKHSIIFLSGWGNDDAVMKFCSSRRHNYPRRLFKGRKVYLIHAHKLELRNNYLGM